MLTDNKKKLKIGLDFEQFTFKEKIRIIYTILLNGKLIIGKPKFKEDKTL